MEETECEVLPSDMLVHLPECKRYVFPDVSITCEKVEIMKKTRNGLQVLINPQIIIEVSSKSTAEDDLGKKMTCYLKLKSLKQYVIISSEKKSIIVYTKDKNGKLDISSFSDEEDIKLGDCTIKIDKIYKRIGFDQSESSESKEIE